MAAFDVERWRRIAPYLDQVLDITNEEDRASWLAALRLENAALADDLQSLLDDQHDLAARHFLEHPPISLSEVVSGGQPNGPAKLPAGPAGTSTVWVTRCSAMSCTTRAGSTSRMMMFGTPL